ncbi:hypothetical protein GOBAR_AA34058 [Gossypium barbadense]|uniref:Uncharacterized protein n=1 Tax=Gossypium barbadense TaxID=3634 RepID=A0A2P5W6B9_GOSBA|nr:hypothetical protein GOBAR_AA34058 [Gossypium barbadense]
MISMAMETLDDEKPEEEEVIDKENEEGNEKQTHQKNQVKDTIDVDEPEERGDPLTAEELEEKERLLEEYVMKLRKPMIYGATSHLERAKILVVM